MFSNVKHVFLDIDNTLLDFGQSACAAAKSAFVKSGLDPAKYDHGVFTGINDSLWAQLERGEICREDIHRTRWGKVFCALGISADGEAFERVFLECIPESVVPVRGAREALEYLSRRYPVYAASNAPHDQQILRLKSAGMFDFFTDVFTSERLGAAKPSSAFFEGIFSRLCTVDPSECVMVGDSVTADVLGASRFGLKTVFFDFFLARPAFCPADAVIYDLDELRRLL